MKLICINFKMNLLIKDIENYITKINNKVSIDNTIFFPDVIHIPYFSKNNYLVGSQDISHKLFGSITGDTSIKQLKELGISYTLIGHSERRKYYNDSKYVNKKLNLALENDIIPVLCVGEKKDDYKNNKTLKKIKKQLDKALKNNINLINNNLIIAYEPIWSIGTNITPSTDEIKVVTNFIKEYFNNLNINIKVLYGGSVNTSNIKVLNEIDEIDGFLIGSSSLNPDNIIEIENILNKL